MKPLTMRQRILGVIKGDPLDRVPFIQYCELPPEPEVLRDQLGRDNVGLLRWTPIHRLEYPSCKIATEEITKDHLRGLRTIITTNSGMITEEKYFEPTFGSASIAKHFVKNTADYVILAEFLEDAVVMEDLSLHAMDCPELVDRCIRAMLCQENEIFEIAANSPADWIDIGDNITAPLIGVENFVKYCVPSYNRLAELLETRELPVIVHMDGDIGPLWSAIGESKVGGIDSLSPPPDNDTSVDQAVAMWPEKRLFVNFPSSVHLADEETIYETAIDILRAGGHSGRLQIQISENVPPGIWRKSYPQIIRAINDFGKP